MTVCPQQESILFDIYQVHSGTLMLTMSSLVIEVRIKIPSCFERFTVSMGACLAEIMPRVAMSSLFRDIMIMLRRGERNHG